MSTENFSDEDMAVVGRAFMEAISNCAPKDWTALSIEERPDQTIINAEYAKQTLVLIEEQKHSTD